MNEAWSAGKMDALQEEYDCCGKIGPSDYIALEQPVPESCYQNHDTSNTTNLFDMGCMEQLRQYYDNEWWLFYLFFWLLVGFEVSSFIELICCSLNTHNNCFL